MLGHLMEWFYSGLGGIYQTDTSVAYSSIVIAPKPVGDIKWVTCSNNSVKGIISSDWQIRENSFVLNLEVPRDVVAKVIIPNEYRGNTCVVTDSSNGKTLTVKVTDGAFELTMGKYEVVAK